MKVVLEEIRVLVTLLIWELVMTDVFVLSAAFVVTAALVVVRSTVGFFVLSAFEDVASTDLVSETDFEVVLFSVVIVVVSEGLVVTALFVVVCGSLVLVASEILEVVETLLDVVVVVTVSGALHTGEAP
ncbi:hypothetical protein HDV02_004232 [Globomyces sp. JEL0801]|nr:hypothetical protein HDV02_004232 [Globomyces sp. JEL0801]